MTDERLDHLIDEHLNGTMSDEARAELEERLLHSATDRARFWELAESHALLHEELQGQRVEETVKPRAKVRSVWLQWRPIAAAAAGIVLGMFGTSMVFAYVAPQMAKRVVLMKEGFESEVVRTVPGLPKETGTWGGDDAEVVDAAGDLKAKTGHKMLRFNSATHAGENAPKSAWSNVYRLVDLSGVAGEETASLRLVANFACASASEKEEYVCFVELCAVEEGVMPVVPPDNLPWYRENSSAIATRKLPLKGDGQWKAINVMMPMPPQASYALVHVAVMRAKPARSAEPVKFGSHYVDDVKLELITPSGVR
ncbi:anti-sigma factor family protein [Prosthecobacter sp.]|uniref:anti-sigma factor family protein n=1 Tax=Prosthecobacter sp. TaxID=1965333 RepID=UPI003783FCAD